MTQFTNRGMQIVEDTLNAVQQADEMEGLELAEYVQVMRYLSDRMQARANNAINILKGEDDDSI